MLHAFCGSLAVNIVRIWDLPTRLFHSALALCFVALVVSGEMAGAAMAWHFRLGYAMLSLLSFRLTWGVVGGHWSRFSSFVHSPSTILGYVRGVRKPEYGAGHNPLGALAVLALLGFSLLQVASGLISDDEIATAGPLARRVPDAWVPLATHYHTEIGKLVLIALVALHLAAIAYYRFRKGEDLIRPMLNGDKALVQKVAPSRDDTGSRTRASLLFLLCIVAVTLFARWAT